MRGVVDRALYDDESRNMFTPIKVQHEKFLDLAIRGKMPAINLALVINEGEVKMIEQKLITLGHKISGKKLCDYYSGAIGIGSQTAHA